MSHVNESRNTWIRHSVILHIIESWHKRISHVTRMNAVSHVWMCHVPYEWVVAHVNASCHTYECVVSQVQMSRAILECVKSHMGWLRLVGSLKLQVSFAKEPYKRDYILQTRPIIIRSLLIVATPYHILICDMLYTDESYHCMNELGAASHMWTCHVTNIEESRRSRTSHMGWLQSVGSVKL